MAVLHPIECYLLEHFTSAEYIAKTRDAVIRLIDAHEIAFARHQSELEPRVRSQPTWQQGDIVWGTRVLPNIRPARERYIKSHIDRTHNDPMCFSRIGNTLSNWNRGICEFWDGWMTEKEKEQISKAKATASKLDLALGASINGSWEEGDLTYGGVSHFYSRSDFPSAIPRYELDPSIRIEKYAEIKEMGIYLPDVDFAPARFLYPNGSRRAIEAVQGIRRSDYICEMTGKRSHAWIESRDVETTWTLIRKVKGEFILIPPEGHFPQGVPGELYNWPSRENYYVERRNRRPTFRMSGDRVPCAGLWSIAEGNKSGHVTLQTDQILPDHQGKPVRWILNHRPDGGELEELIPDYE
ncbi:hypothetical protein [Pseudomonas sp. zfem002]|uniref:hypothetical protein n=1 Tax=Pseudomonas sp. zfem002 TaxID=3078197 RepID=UPI002927A454|nr:hypothetical protein [Pseudomonas sp. zfem002]MDU9393581.1 hypothetical protein [Pseudomonas sp. zfem002]